MWPYWMMYLMLALPAMLVISKPRNRSSFTLIFAGLLLVIFIGYRDHVGGDWGTYLRHFRQVKYIDLIELVSLSDPGYKFVNWLMSKWGLDIYAVNLLCASIFTSGLVAFAHRQPYPWLALSAAFPYVIIVLGMGYTRQGVALGFIFFALNALEYRQFKRYLIYIALATLFHKTALVMIPLGLFIWGSGWVYRATAIFATAYVLFDLLLAEQAEHLWSTYVDAQMASQGALIRVLMNVVPASILLIYWKTWKESFPNYWFWFWIAAGSIMAVGLVGIASTAVDRIALYFIPIQLVVFARMPILLRQTVSVDMLKIGIVLGYALVLYVWLNYATHAKYWLPYQNVLFQ